MSDTPSSTIIIVRAWRDRDGLKIRLMGRSDVDASTTTAVETSAAAAQMTFGRWMSRVQESGSLSPARSSGVPRDDTPESAESSSYEPRE